MFWAFRDRIIDLKRDHRFRYILLFKNHGEAAGASLEHPHSQLIALPVVPKRVKEEMEAASAISSFKERCIFCDIIRQETASGARVVLETDEIQVISTICAALSLRNLDPAQAAQLAFRGLRGATAAESRVGAALHDAQDR